MENNSLKQFIDKALLYYDEQNNKYLNLINTKNYKIKKIQEVNLESGIIKFNKKYEFYYEILGYFDNQHNIWIWSWVLPNLDNELTIISKDLLIYGLKLEYNRDNLEHSIIKSLLVNSRILLEDFIQLEIYLAIISYIIKNKILFIFPIKIYIDKKKKLFNTFYYLIKKI